MTGDVDVAAMDGHGGCIIAAPTGGDEVVA